MRTNLLEIIRSAHERGWFPVLVSNKITTMKSWQDFRFDPDDPSHVAMFNGALTESAIYLGVSCLVDLEADCVTAECALAELATSTWCVGHMPDAITGFTDRLTRNIRTGFHRTLELTIMVMTKTYSSSYCLGNTLQTFPAVVTLTSFS